MHVHVHIIYFARSFFTLVVPFNEEDDDNLRFFGCFVGTTCT